MSDMTNLARTVIFVMGSPVKVRNDLYTQNEYRQDKRDAQQSGGCCFAHLSVPTLCYVRLARVSIITGI